VAETGGLRVVIVGGGVIGLWCARDLLRAGADVTVLDRPSTGVSTPASAGWVVPALSAPLSGPGVVRHSVQSLLRRQAAFSIRPRLSPTLVSWLWGFVRSGTEQRHREGLRAILDLAGAAAREYDALLDAGVGFEIHRRGLVLVARTSSGLHEAQALLGNAAAAGYDGKYEVLDRHEVHSLEPALHPDIIGGVHARDEVHVRPEQLIAALRTDVESMGGTLRRDRDVKGIVTDGRRSWKVVTDQRSLTADRVVVAAGIWSRTLLEGLGAGIPLLPAAGYSVTGHVDTPPDHALKLMEPNVAVSPFGNGVRLAGRFALGRHGSSTRATRRVLSAAAPYLRSGEPTADRVEQVGLRPVTPDSLPVIGPVPGKPGVLAATGHGMLGLTLAPGTAAEITRQATTGQVSDNARQFSIERLGRSHR
jgi:D-amino-acid dehydrogenase